VTRLKSLLEQSEHHLQEEEIRRQEVAENTNFIVFGLTNPDLNPRYTTMEGCIHYTTDAVSCKR
jgi:hypothetical protein